MKYFLQNFPKLEVFTITLKELSFILMEEPMLHLFKDSKLAADITSVDYTLFADSALQTTAYTNIISAVQDNHEVLEFYCLSQVTLAIWTNAYGGFTNHLFSDFIHGTLLSYLSNLLIKKTNITHE